MAEKFTHIQVIATLDDGRTKARTVTLRELKELLEQE